jgi:hypothetical protein
MEVAPFARALGLHAHAVHGAPMIDVTARATFGGGLAFQLLGHIAAPRLSYRGEEFEEVAADFSWDGTRWSARDVRVVHRTGLLTGDILHAPGGVRTRLRNSIEAEVLRPLLGELMDES